MFHKTIAQKHIAKTYIHTLNDFHSITFLKEITSRDFYFKYTETIAHQFSDITLLNFKMSQSPTLSALSSNFYVYC